jgi:hypothetical protein
MGGVPTGFAELRCPTTGALRLDPAGPFKHPYVPGGAIPCHWSRSALGLLSPDHPCWDDQVAMRWPLIRIPRYGLVDAFGSARVTSISSAISPARHLLGCPAAATARKTSAPTCPWPSRRRRSAIGGSTRRRGRHMQAERCDPSDSPDNRRSVSGRGGW